MIRRRLYAEIRFSKLALWSWRFAAFALPVYVISVILHRAGAVEYQSAIAILGAALLIALISAVMAVAAFVVIWNEGLKGLGAAMLGLVISVAMLSVPVFHVARGIQQPAISDISTDTADPPRFQIVSTMRPANANAVTYPAENAKLQQMHYPAVRPAELDAEAQEVSNLIVAIMQRNGWRVIERSGPRKAGADETIEAVAYSLILGVPEDIAIRMRATKNGVRVDMRSASRYGSRDFGSNARRIETFFKQLAETRRRVP
ncbi:MAG TPA: DUF1499 domain-containing protein [Xanthobacteraceae bacterium]|nr:DUF1499 domain-containing protein [Xanthobacteraceae bacterium]